MKPSESILSPLGLTLPDCEDEASHWSLSDLERIVRAMLADKDTRALPPSFFASVCSSDEDQEDMKCTQCGQPWHHNGGNCPKRFDMGEVAVVDMAGPAPAPEPSPKKSPARQPERYQEAIASRYAAGESIGELGRDYRLSRDLLEEAIRVTLRYLFEAYVAAHPTPTSSPSEDNSEPRTAAEAWDGLPDSIRAVLAKASFVAGYNHAGVEAAMARMESADAPNAEASLSHHTQLSAERGVALEGAEARIAQLEAETMTLTSERDGALAQARSERSGNASLNAQLDMWQDAAHMLEKERGEAKAELARHGQLLKSGNEWRAKAERTIAELETKAKNWEFLYYQALVDCGKVDVELRKHRAVVEAARDVAGRSSSPDGRVPAYEMRPLVEALSALDQQPEPTSPPELPDSSAQAPRKIGVGSTWRLPSGEELTVTRAAGGGIYTVQTSDGCWRDAGALRESSTCLSDPPDAEEPKPDSVTHLGQKS